MAEIYQPSEDSILLSKALEKKIPKLIRKDPNLTFLEIGPGSGIQLKTALESGVKKENIFSADLNQNAVKHCKSLGFNCIKSNLFENVKGLFDVIVFNPPYLPFDGKEPSSSRMATTGGKFGGELITKFLKGAKNHLEKNGRIFVLVSSMTKNTDFSGFKKKKVASEKLFFEELFVYELSIRK